MAASQRYVIQGPLTAEIANDLPGQRRHVVCGNVQTANATVCISCRGLPVLGGLGGGRVRGARLGSRRGVPAFCRPRRAHAGPTMMGALIAGSVIPVRCPLGFQASLTLFRKATAAGLPLECPCGGMSQSTGAVGGASPVARIRIWPPGFSMIR